jgi:PTH1 family peptidyl-tRNA hydrolase
VAERIVVGLGNPGREYERSRHNVGFMVVERLAQRWAIGFMREPEGLHVGSGPIAGIPTRLVQPREYMNLAGTTLLRLPGPWHVEDLVVVYDDIDLPAGQLRVRHDGGAGGHRGLSSLIDVFGPAFDRVRVGVGRPPETQEPAAYVLEPLTNVDLRHLDETIEQASDAVECLLANGLQQTMNRFNVRQSGAPGDASASDAARRSSCDDTRH